jgi:hypothetical protein
MTYYFCKVECLHVFILQFGNFWIKNFHCNGLAETVPSLGHHVLLTLQNLISSAGEMYRMVLKLFFPCIIIQITYIYILNQQMHKQGIQSYSLIMPQHASVL